MAETNQQDAVSGLLAKALDHHQQGRLDEAGAAYQTLLEQQPGNADVLQLYGAVCCQTGDLEQAETLLRRSIEIDPRMAAAYCNLGNVLTATAREPDAIAAYRAALDIDSRQAQAHVNLANLLLKHDDLETAESHYQAALTEQPDFPQARLGLAELWFRRGDPGKALRICSELTQSAPEFPEAHLMAGRLLLSMERASDAWASFYACLALVPQHAGAHAGMGEVFEAQGLDKDAARAWARAAALAPADSGLWNKLGTILQKMGDQDGAESAWRNLLALEPENIDAWARLGVILHRKGQLEEALDALGRVVQAEPNHALALKHLGQIHNQQYHPDAALPCLERALALSPDDIQLQYDLAYAQGLLGQAKQAVARLQELVDRHPEFPGLHDTLLMYLAYDPDLSAADLFQRHKEWGQRHGKPHARPTSWPNDRNPDRPLKIGYLSRDFGRHAVGNMILDTLIRHDAENYKIHYYSERPNEDDITARFREAAHAWRPTRGVSDDQLARMIRNDGIDILVDLAGHTTGNRLTAMALKPAPIQASWIGYGDTTGLDAIDYIILDDLTAPPELDRYFTETVIRLPNTRFCYSPPDYSPEVAPPPVESNGYITFGSFSNLLKLNPRLVRLWSQVLKSTPESRLLLNWRTLGIPSVREDIRDAFRQQGVDPARILLESDSLHEKVLRGYARVDIALDTTPYSGGVTTCEALWMGVPVVTLVGERPIARQSSAIINAAGFPEWITHDEPTFVETAQRLALDRAELARLRAAQRARLQQSPLMDYTGEIQALEAVYRQLWRNYVDH